MTITWERGWRRASFELDSEVGFNLIVHGCSETHPRYALIASIWIMTERNWRVNFNHCYREGNQVTDRLACYAHSAETQRPSQDF